MHLAITNQRLLSVAPVDAIMGIGRSIPKRSRVYTTST